VATDRPTFQTSIDSRTEQPLDPAGAPPRLTDHFQGIGVVEPKRFLEAMPALAYVAASAADEDPTALERFHLLCVPHFLSDLIGFAQGLADAGLSWERAHFFWKPYRYPYRERIANYLTNLQADVKPLDQIDVVRSTVREVVAASRKDGRKIVIVEDGGYLVPLVHREFRDDLDLFQGAVEQTSKGLAEDKKVMPFAFPVASIADTRIKTEFEAPAVAQAVWENVRSLLFHVSSVNADRVLVVGFGKIGQALGLHLKAQGVHVKVADPRAWRRKVARRHGLEAGGKDICPLVRGEHGLVVIGATGRKSIGLREILALEHQSVLVSASSDQVEIGLPELARLSQGRRGTVLTNPLAIDKKVGDWYRIVKTQNEILLLAEGYPVNFWERESLPPRVAQVALAPLFLATLGVCLRAEEMQTQRPDGTSIEQWVTDASLYEFLQQR
jgi:adenosylhomocysteinase